MRGKAREESRFPLSALDWIVLLGSIAAIVGFGLRRARGAGSYAGYLLGGRVMPWPVMAFSIMATQASAITFISTTGQGYADGMRFVQFYFGLPIAMVVIAAVFLPRFMGSGVFTAYEYLERRFDAKTRALVTLLFLMQRGSAVGIAIHAQAIALAVILGLPDRVTGMLVGGIVVLYTAAGGIQAVAWTQFLQMIVMTLGLIVAFATALVALPEGIGFGGALAVAGAAERLNPIVLGFDWNDRYNLWTGLIGGSFLALAYFGCDQTQVQRYLAGRSEAASRTSLMFNALAKIPFQFFILSIGAAVFAFYTFTAPPMIFEPAAMQRLADDLPEFSALEGRYNEAFEARKQAAAGMLADPAGAAGYVAAQERFEQVRGEAIDAAGRTGGESRFNDTNYIFLTFVTQHLPPGLIGLVMAAILGAAMSSIASQINSLATVTAVDLYRRHWVKEASEEHYLRAAKALTVAWGVFAVLTTEVTGGYGALIETINMIGSLFYGSLLGIFVLAFFFPRVGAPAAFAGIAVGQASVFWTAAATDISFLWFNVVGCAAVVASALLFSRLPAARRAG